MNKLISALKEYQLCYGDDTEGFQQDFALTVGFTVEELTERLDDEITQLKSFEDDED